MIVPYQPTWQGEYQTEEERLRMALGGLARRLEHHGSTAVPGLAAKPIIDIQVSVDSLSPLASYRVPLEGLGYHHVSHQDDSFAPFFHRPGSWPHTHHVHVVVFGGVEESRTLALRDYLRDHPSVAAQYGELKLQLSRHSDWSDAACRDAYAMAKTEFIERVVAVAQAGGYPHPWGSVA